MTASEMTLARTAPRVRGSKALAATLLCGLAYKLLLDAILIYYLPGYFYTIPQYAASAPLWKIALSYALLLPLLAWCPQGTRAEALLTRIALFMVVIPMLCVYGAQDRNTLYMLLVSGCWWLVEVIISADIGFALRSRYSFNRLIYPLFVLMALGMAALLFRSFGMPSLSTLNLATVYETRAENVMGKYVAYTFQMVVRVVMPLFIVVFLLRRQWVPLLAALALDLCFYLWTGNKTVLFSMPLILGAGMLFRYRKSEQVVSMLFPLLWGAVMACRYLYERIGIPFMLWPLPLVERTFVLPAMLKFFYFDFFLKNPLLGLYGTVLAPFLSGGAPYVDQPFTRMISQQNMGVVSGANTGMFGGELAHFGPSGVFIAMALALLFLLIVRLCRLKNGNLFAVCLALYATVSLTDATVSSLFLSFDGILLIMVLLFYHHRDTHDIQEREDFYGRSL